MTAVDVSARLFLQIAVILAACRAVGWAGVRFGQAVVVSEMVAGVLLGPSLLGAVAPTLHRWLFPPESLPILHAASQVGLVLYMFLIGAEFRIDEIRPRLRSAATIATAGIVAPFLLGCAIGAYLLNDTRFFAAGVSPWQGMAFLGTAMSITAFPMLARILHDKGMADSPLGTLALAAGSSGDVAAWCLLAVVLASFTGDPLLAVTAIGGGLLYAGAVVLFGRPAFARLEARTPEEGGLAPSRVTWVLVALMFGAWITDTLGIYAIFGAFFLGAAVPAGRLSRALHTTLGPLTISLLLPLFFVYSGLHTRIDRISSPALVGVALVVLLASCLGKGVACWAAARLHGEGRREAVALAALLNARGLMELIILNIGLERGIITPTLFTVMVVMAIATTLMASPVFELAMRGRAAPQQKSVTRTDS